MQPAGIRRRAFCFRHPFPAARGRLLRPDDLPHRAYRRLSACWASMKMSLLARRPVIRGPSFDSFTFRALPLRHRSAQESMNGIAARKAINKTARNNAKAATPASRVITILATALLRILRVITSPYACFCTFREPSAFRLPSLRSVQRCHRFPKVCPSRQQPSRAHM